MNNKIIKELENAHREFITNIRHYFDNKFRIDFLLTVFDSNRNIKLWNINNYDYPFDIHAYKDGRIDSVSFLNNNNKIYILDSNSCAKYKSAKSVIPENVKIFNLVGDEIKEINDSNDHCFFIDTLYDNNCSKNFIITGNLGYLKSYDFDNNKLYHKYYDNENIKKMAHFSAVINKNENLIKLIDSSKDGFIRIWNFHSNILLNKINLNSGKLYGICLWNDNNLLVVCEDKTIKLLNINNNTIVKEFKGHGREEISIKKIYHNKYGECIISQGKGEDQIKLWMMNDL